MIPGIVCFSPKTEMFLFLGKILIKILLLNGLLNKKKKTKFKHLLLNKLYTMTLKQHTELCQSNRWITVKIEYWTLKKTQVVK